MYLSKIYFYERKSNYNNYNTHSEKVNAASQGKSLGVFFFNESCLEVFLISNLYLLTRLFLFKKAQLPEMYNLTGYTHKGIFFKNPSLVHIPDT